MRLTKIKIKNFRSISNLGPINIEALQAFVGENNSGKSNILRAISCFLTVGARGIKEDDFKKIEQKAIIECTFSGLSNQEKKKLKRYLINDSVILKKDLWIESDDKRGKPTIKSEYHGYQAEPVEDYLSISKIIEKYGSRPKWAEIAKQNGIEEYVADDAGNINKNTYTKGVSKIIQENEVEFEEPELGETQALGIPQNLLQALPKFYLLPAITDYSDEVDRRSSSTVFRRLMSDLADRVLRTDPRYRELEEALEKVRSLLNPLGEDGDIERLESLSSVEDSLRYLIEKLMPSVDSIKLNVEIEATKDLFAKGVNIRVDDGVLTSVIDKGHGMQRSVVFSLLQMLISSSRVSDQLESSNSIILAIEEPELYIHPHCQRLIFRVLKEFAGLQDEDNPEDRDQVIYTTHSPAFVDVWKYERIGMVKKLDVTTGTIVKQAPSGTISGADDRKTLKILTSFGIKHNEVFFGQEAIIVEGPEDEIAIIATARKIGRISDLLDELGVTILVSGGKGDIPKFQKILSAFSIKYGVLYEMDGKDDEYKQNKPILENLGNGRLARVHQTIENIIGLGRHFNDQSEAKSFFSCPENINQELIDIVNILLPQE